MYDMVNIFEVFLPQLLRYPNPTDPLNGEAAALMMREPKSYEAKVKGSFSAFANDAKTRILTVRKNTLPSTHRKKRPMMLEKIRRMTTR